MALYDSARAYQVAFSYRDVPAEVDVLLGWYARHSRSGGAPARVLELAAGPADHAREFARRGIPATALDLSPAMCDLAREQAAGLPVEVVRADMTDFDLGSPVDLSMLLLSSDCYLLDLDAYLGHLAAVARHLRPGGLHVIESTHPADIVGDGRTESSWTVEAGDLRVTTSWGDGADRLDPLTLVVPRTVRLRIERDGTERDGGTEEVVDVVPERQWTFTEVAAAVRLSGAFDRVACYGAYTGIDVADPKAWRMISVLPRR